MHDDIAHNPLNPRQGGLRIVVSLISVFNRDYTREQVTTKNLYAMLLGNKSDIEGGSGKVIDSKSDDRILIYYSDHGGPGVLGMPNMPYLFAADFIEVLKKNMHPVVTKKW
ncbi:unnamed protein product [Musa acuminata subsp. malaccensis]|uniref:(wild Malaysian banana) hypothetical protein n=1 Tax=Musa acuminata subsp. malaccensis TaxID=214687 RepID=A0A8D7EWI1_MUSAM|nr:unnamed protein product [Musa acuminata subsp. malaccensis]